MSGRGRCRQDQLAVSQADHDLDGRITFRARGFRLLIGGPPFSDRIDIGTLVRQDAPGMLVLRTSVSQNKPILPSEVLKRPTGRTRRVVRR